MTEDTKIYEIMMSRIIVFWLRGPYLSSHSGTSLRKEIMRNPELQEIDGNHVKPSRL